MKKVVLSLLGLLVTPCLFGQNLSDGLVFYATFDGNTVNLVNWAKPRNYGVALADDRSGTTHAAVFFDGEQSILDYGDIIRLEEEHSISCWIRPEDPATLGLAVGGWHHLAVVRSGVRQQMYLDGQESSMASFPPFFHFGPDNSFLIGVTPAPNGVSEDYFRGSLDEVRIYNRALNLREVEELYGESLVLENELRAGQSGNLDLTVAPYPNPTTRLLNLKFTKAADRRLEVVDDSGRMLAISRSDGDFVSLNVAGFPPGTYFLRVREADQLVVHKFLKQGAVLP